jgi:hypothetical protein
MRVRCNLCEEVYPGGTAHKCKPRPTATPQPKPRAPVTHGVTHTVTHEIKGTHKVTHTPLDLRKANTVKVARWRAKNLDRHREYHAAYMRRWRAERAEARQ